MYQKISLRTCLALLNVAFLVNLAEAQPKETPNLIDSLKREIPAATGKEKYILFYSIAYELFDVDNVQALEYASQAYTLARQLGDSLEITKSGRIVGQLLRRLDRLDDAIVQFTEILPIAERNQILDEEKRILNALAISFSFKAMYDKALQYNFRSLEIREREGNEREIGIALNNIGFVYYKLGDFEKARDFYERALEIKQRVNDKSALDQLLINLALCHVYLGSYDKAREFTYKGFDVCKEECSDQIKVEGEFCLGMSFTAVGNYDEAEVHFTESYEIAKRISDKRFQAESALSIATIRLEKEDYDGAKRALLETEDISKNSGYNQILIYTYLRFSRLFKETNDFEKAAEYQSKYIQLKDSIYSEDLIKNLARVQTDYEQRVNIKTIAEQDEILLLNQLVIARQKQVYFFVGLVAILSIVGTYMFLRYSRALSKAKQELSIMNQSLERRVEDRTKALQNVNNELDNFIYKTSHDIRGPLASLKGIANVALMEIKEVKAQDYLHKLDASADKLNSILTRLLIVNQINHAVLTPQLIDFTELIQEILVFERKKGIPSRMAILHEVDSDVALVTDKHMLRIILENLIDNAIKYHNNSERVEPFVKIKVELHHRGILIRVIDNGIGIQGERDPQKLFTMFVRASERSESGGIGLYLTKLATERLFARVDFTTTAEKYTQFSVMMPENLNLVLEKKEMEDLTGTA